MQKNWYAAYTKPTCEKKVAHLLAKKGNETCYPMVEKISASLWWSRVVYKPLMECIVFVRATDEQVRSLGKNMNCMLSLLYFAESPAIISDEDIEAMRGFTQHYREIEIEKILVNSQDDGDQDREVVYQMEGKILLVKNKVARLRLPSLGIVLVAKIKDTEVLGHKVAYGKEALILQ